MHFGMGIPNDVLQQSFFFETQKDPQQMDLLLGECRNAYGFGR